MRAGTHRSLIVLLTIVSIVAACAGSGATTGPSSTPAAPIVAPTAIPAGATPALAPTLAPTPTLAPAPVSTPPPASDVYVVVAGDTLWEIAQRYDRTVDELLAANPQIMDRSLIRVGDNIAIPSDDVHALWNATVNLPALPVPAADGTSLPPGCVEGRVTFVDGHGFPPGAEREWYDSTWIEDVVRADVDHDDTTDVVALIKCRLGEGSFGRVVAFRPRPDGTFSTIGLVLQQDWGTGGDNEIARLSGIDATPAGEILVVVGDYKTTYTDGPWVGLCQGRTFGWDGHAFVQTAGPTTFVVPPGAVNLTVTASPMTYAKPVNGTRVGTMTVAVRNAGTATVEDVSVLLGMDPWAVCAVSGASLDYLCEIGRLDPGAATTVTFHQSIPACEAGSACADGTDESGDLQVRVGDQKYSDTQGIRLVFK